MSFVADNVGRILTALENRALVDNMIVFILGDHGFWSEYSMLEATRMYRSGCA